VSASQVTPNNQSKMAPDRVDEAVGALAGRWEAEIRRRMAEHDVPGLAVGVCDRTGMLWSAVFGTRRAGADEPVTHQTMFSVQSCSKMYTATAVMMAVKDGLVDLDEPILRYLPEFRVKSRFEAHPERTITLRHLLSHTAGFTHEAPIGSNYLVGTESFAAHCESINETWLRFPVGHHYEYSNLGIDLAGYILQRASGIAFHRYARRHLLDPLGLHRTTFDQARIGHESNRALGHSRLLGHRLAVRIPMVAAGGLYTSIEDACRYMQFHLDEGGSLLDPGLLGEMYAVPFRPPGQVLGYGLGVASFERNGVLFRGHGGGGFGFLSDMSWAPGPAVGVVVLTNSVDHPLQVELAAQICKDLIGDPAPEPVALPDAVPVPSDARDRLGGTYIGRGDNVATFTSTESQSSFTFDGRTHVVRFVAPNEFVLEDNARARFCFLEDTSDLSGRPRYLQEVGSGYVRYRNDVPETLVVCGDAPGTEDPSALTFRVKISGVTAGTVRLRRANGDIGLTFEYAETVGAASSPAPTTLRLEQYAPGILFCATGNALDLNQTPPTYANVRLHPLQ
jgi:CubicO group peptidase (beta-lactamase class C family)